MGGVFPGPAGSCRNLPLPPSTPQRTVGTVRPMIKRLRKEPCGLTLIELLVAVAMLGLLLSLVLPAVCRARAKATGAACLANLKQLQLCWQMYADDFHGAVPPNQSLLLNGVWRSAPDSWIGFSHAPRDPGPGLIQRGLFYRHGYNRAVALYRCPADQSRVEAAGGRQPARRRTRSYALNGNLGGRASEVQVTVRRLDEIPEPGRLLAFVDEAEDSIDDAHFLVWPAPDTRWVNLPAGRHGQTGVLSFVDGHAERWRWRSPKRFTPRESYWRMVVSESDLRDLRALQSVTLSLAGFVPQP